MAKKLIDYAMKGNVDAQYSVGMDYLRQADSNAAVDVGIGYIFSAAENGHKDAMIMWRTILDKAEAGDAYLQTLLGIMYSQGYHAKKDENIGVEWLLKAADTRVEAIGWILKLAETGCKNVIAYKQKIMEMAEAGDPNIQYILALIYAGGLGVEKDDGTAAIWIIKAAENGQKDAIAHIKKFRKEQYNRLASSGIWLILIIVLNLIIKGSHFMFYMNSMLVGLFISNFTEPLLRIFGTKKYKRAMLLGCSRGLLSLTCGVFMIVMSIQSCGGRQIDNKLYNFLKGPPITELVVAMLPGSDISATQISPAESKEFITQRNITELREETGSIKDIIIIVVVFLGTYFFSRFLIIKKMFHQNIRAKVVAGLFIPIAIFALFFTEIHIYIVITFLGIGMSCFSVNQIAEESEK